MTDRNMADAKNEQSRKNFFLDTSALMLNSLTVFSLASCPVPDELKKDEKTRFYNLVEEFGKDIKLGAPNNIYISSMVEWELNNIKDDERKDPLARLSARDAISVLTEIKEYGATKHQSMKKGIELPNGSMIYSVEHDEENFLDNNKRLYQPNRDDRIIYDYVDHVAKHIIHKENKPNKPKPQIPLIEIVTEDHNFRGKVYDEFSDLQVKAKCNPLLSERTESPNPGNKYTGMHKERAVLDNATYLNFLTSDEIISNHELVKMVLNGSRIDWDVITHMHPNQFLIIEPDDKEKIRSSNENIPEYHFLKKTAAGFSTLRHYNKFMKEEYSDADDELPIVDINALTNKSLLLQIITESNLSNKQKNKLKGRINTINPQDIINTVKGHIAEKRLEKLAARDKNALIKGSKSVIYHRALNPLVLPVEDQKAYVDLLVDDHIGLITFLGPQGVGKTYFSLAAGYSMVKQGKYQRIVYLKPLTTTGEGIGFLPGSEEKKTAPVMQSCYDSLEKLLSLKEDNAFYKAYPHLALPEDLNMIEEMKKNKILETEIITYIAGRTIDNAFIIFDEAQLLNREQMRLMIGRVGQKSKLVLIGDFAQLAAANAEVRKKYDIITPRNAGLSHVIESMNNPKTNCPYKNIYGHLTSSRKASHRSEVASISEWIL